MNVLEKAINHYHAILMSPEGEYAREYLKKTYQMDEKDMVESRIGYAPCEWRSLSKAIEPDELTEAVSLRLVILRDGGVGGWYDYFRNRIIYLHTSGKYLVGELMDKDEPRFLNSLDV